MRKEINLEILQKKLENYINNQISKSDKKKFSTSIRDFGELGKRLTLLHNGERNSISAFEWGNFCQQIKYSYATHPDNVNE
tara:strand:- start:679 stop:921 length:243 start_codon:yes stop_codon:yes gene_type:complete